MAFRLGDLLRRTDGKSEGGYSRALQAARVRAAYQRSYFAPALFSLIPVATDLIDSMAVDVHWRLYYNDVWVARHTVEENATLLIHEVGHLLRDHAVVLEDLQFHLRGEVRASQSVVGRVGRVALQRHWNVLFVHEHGLADGVQFGHRARILDGLHAEWRRAGGAARIGRGEAGEVLRRAHSSSSSRR